MQTKDGPVAIDHDLSFPTNPPRNCASLVPTLIAVPFQVQTEDGIRVRERAVDNVFYRNYCMPPVIDREMYNVIMAIDLQNLEATYRECGLTRFEIGAAMGRARGLQAAAQWLWEQSRVIEPTRWAESQRVKNFCNDQNFYAARHYH
jgi:hypothetical protein